MCIDIEFTSFKGLVSMFASTDGLDLLLPILINTYLRNARPLLTRNLFSLEHVEFWNCLVDELGFSLVTLTSFK